MNLPHTATVERAHAAIKSGQINSGEWNAPPEGDRDQADCLGAGKKYPVFSGGKLSKHALANAEARATTNGHPEIANKAKALLKMIADQKDEPVAVAASASPAPVYDGLMINSEGEFLPALSLGGNLPKERNGIPVQHFWKEALLPAGFKDAKGRVWNFGPRDIDDVLTDCKRSLALGWEPPIQDDHWKPGKSFGKVIDYRKNNRGGLEMLHQFMGEDEAKECLKKHTSIMLIPNKEDARGNKFKWYPDHSASVFRPQLPELKDFTPALAASGHAVNAVQLIPMAETQESDMDISKLRAALGLAEDKPVEEVIALAAAEIDQIASMRKTNLALSGEVADWKTASSQLAGQLQEAEQARDQAIALSAEVQEEPADPRLTAMLAENVRTARELALQGGVTPAQVKLFDDILGSGGNYSALALSACGPTNHPLAYQVYNALRMMSKNFIETRRKAPENSFPAQRPKEIALALSGSDPNPPVDPDLTKQMAASASCATQAVSGMAKMTSK